MSYIYVAVPCRNWSFSVAYFDRITAFETLCCWTSIKGGAQFVGSLDIYASTKRVWAPPLAKVQQYSASNSNAIEIRDRITFDFYMGLPHILTKWNNFCTSSITLVDFLGLMLFHLKSLPWSFRFLILKWLQILTGLFNISNSAELSKNLIYLVTLASCSFSVTHLENLLSWGILFILLIISESILSLSRATLLA